jgi:PPK2 family polyphosphate:nucleotide phosphotransferase
MSWASQLSKPYRVKHGGKFRLKDYDPADTGKIDSKEKGQSLLGQGIAAMQELQDRLYAQDRWALLLIFQGMDAAGKDGLVKHVMSGVNPEGCVVSSFKQPSAEELNHDYLWRAAQRLPMRGQIGIFNRSYYEEVLVVRVHKGVLQNERIPNTLITKSLWKERFEDINAWERYLSRNGVVIRKFYLNLSKEEQKRRFLSRLDEPEKNWKFSSADVHEREYWSHYAQAYEEMIAHTATKHAPWYVVPADNKWFTRAVVAAAIVDTLEDLKLKYPVVGSEERKRLKAAKAELGKED